MIEKERSFGVSFFAVTHIVLAGLALVVEVLLGIFLIVIAFIFPSTFKEGFGKVNPGVSVTLLALATIVIWGIGLAVSIFIVKMGRGLLRLEPWARKALLVYSALVLIVTAAQGTIRLPEFISLLYYGVALVYFLLPKVKAQFHPVLPQVTPKPPFKRVIP